MHVGDPCIHCSVASTDVESGNCPNSGGDGGRIRRFLYWKSLLADHEKSSAAETSRLRGLIEKENTAILQIGQGLDFEKISLAETVMYVSGDFQKAGEDREKCRTQAVHWFATNESRGRYGNLKFEYFGTKSYDRWYGQGSDHEYGFGPRHGSIIFSIGLEREARQRDLTPEEREACIYYLLNLTTIQEAQKQAKIPAAV
jgi:hypothetical protein